MKTKKENYNMLKARNKVTDIIVEISRFVFLVAFSYILLYPFAYMISHALRSPTNNLDPTVEWLPKAFSIEPIKVAFDVLDFWNGLKNTFLAEVVTTAISVISCGFAAYGMSRHDFKGKKIMQFFLILSILLPSSMVIIPNYINYRHFDILGILGLFNRITNIDLRPNLLETIFAFWLPAIFAVGLKSGFLIYIYEQFYKGIPKELEEAAWVDGASPLKTYIRIVLPSSGVAILTVSLLSLIWNWNDYYSALMYWQNNKTLAVRLSTFYSQMTMYDTAVLPADATLAACLLFVIPVLVVYLILQKKFVTSIAATGIVG